MLKTEDSNKSNHYLGNKGESYFSYQNKGGLQRGLINARKFSRYIQSTDTVLDFGCGSGALLLNLDCQNRIGIEINPIARAEANRIGIEVYESLEKIGPQTVDVIISNHSLEHTLCPFLVLQQIFEKLVKGGRLILSLPIDDWRNQKRFNQGDIDHHLFTWTPLLIGNLLCETGYRIEDVWIYTHAWPPLHWQKLNNILPVWFFDILCTFTAWRYKRRQVMALAVRP